MGNRPSIPLPDHVRAYRSAGRTYSYFQRNRGTPKAGRSIRLYGELFSQQWWESYYEASGECRVSIRAGTFEAAIEEWQSSAEWLDMKLSTRREWQRHCRKILDWWGDLEVCGLEVKHIRRFRDYYKVTPGEANNSLRCLTALLQWSAEQGYRSDNPARGIKKFKLGSYAPWPWHVVEDARRNLPDYLWRAAALALYTGQRQSDVLAMRRDRMRNGMITVRQEKTDKLLDIPIHRELLGIVEAIPHDAITILANKRGVPWGTGFKSSWRKGRTKMVKQEGLVFHGLRHTAVVNLLECGCTDAQVSAITGQSRQVVEHYAKQVNQRKLAKSAMSMWDAKTEHED